MTEQHDEQSSSIMSTIDNALTSVEQQPGQVSNGPIVAQVTALGERSVASGGDIQDSVIVTGDNNFVQVIKKYRKYVRHPPTLYRDVRRFVLRHYLVLTGAVLLELGLAGLFYRYQDCYLIRWGVYLALAPLLGVVIWYWYSVVRRWKMTVERKKLWLLPGVLTMAWMGVLGGQAWVIWKPEPFKPNEFGIAIATFGGESFFRAPAQGREIASLLYADLKTQIDNHPGLSKQVALRRIGLGGDDGEWANARGDAIGAKLVIWGRLVAQGKGVKAYFRVLQASALLDNPAIPQAIPITPRTIESTLQLPYDLSSNFEKTVAKQSLGIAAFSLGLAHFYNRNFRLAAEEFESALERLEADPADCQVAEAQQEKNLGLIYYYLGRSHQLLGNYTASQAQLTQAAVCNPHDLAVLLSQIYNYRVMGEDERRKQAFQDVIALSYQQPSWAENQAAYDRALAYRALEEPANALRELEAILLRDPTFFVAYLDAASVQTQLGEFEEAEALYDAAEPLATSDSVRAVWLALGRGRLYEQRGDAKAAIAAYQHALDLDEEHTVTSAYYFLAELYARTGDKEEATRTYKKLVEISEVAYWAHGAYATYLYGIQEYEHAIDQFLEALRYPMYSDAMLRAQLGMAYAAVNEEAFPEKESLALAAFEKAVATLSVCPRVSAASQQSQEETNRPNNPGNGEVYIRSEYGRILGQFGRYEAAIQQYECAFDSDRGLAVVTRRNLGQLYEMIGETQKAIEKYQSLLELCEQIPREQIEILQFAHDRLQVLEVEAKGCSLLPVG